MSNKNIDILSIDAKDLYISNHYLYDPADPGQERDGYCIRYRSGPDEGKINISRFINSLDYSLDLIKLRQVYQKVYRNKKFSFTQNGHEYTTRVINVTFKYSNKEFNRVRRDIYVRSGYDFNMLTFTDNICLDEEGKLRDYHYIFSYWKKWMPLEKKFEDLSELGKEAFQEVKA